MRAWPAGGPLWLHAFTQPRAAFVLLLPVAGARCEGTEDDANASDAVAATVAEDASVLPAVQWKVVHGADNVVVRLVAPSADRAARRESSRVFERVYETGVVDDLSARQSAFSVDELRALLWRVVSRPSKSESKRGSNFLLLRGFERLRKAHRRDAAFVPMNNAQPDDDLDDDDLDDGHLADGHLEGVSVDDDVPRRIASLPSLSLPTLPSFPDTPLVSPGTSTMLKRKRSLRPLDLTQLDLEQSMVAPVDAESRAATAALSRICDYLYVGGKASASLPADVLIEHGIVAVINLAAAVLPNEKRHQSIEYTRVYVRDAENEDAAALVPVVALAVERARARNGAALVHCHRGVSRSAAMAAAVLMLQERRDAAWALREIRKARPVASPNPGFVRALKTLEMTLNGEGPRRLGFLARLHGDPGDGEECLVAKKAAAVVATEPAWAAVVLERGVGKGVVAARGALVHEKRWRMLLRLARWIEARDASAARRGVSAAVGLVTESVVEGEIGEVLALGQ